jgi:predicted nucleotidyltransferase
MMRNKMISYAMDFTAFLVENEIFPKKVILFGSVVTGEFDKESDVDIFIDIDKSREKDIMGILRNFNLTYGEKWKMKGIFNPISLKIGDLKKWPELRRSMQSYGILLYAKYNEQPDSVKSYLLFRLNFSNLSRAKKVGIWRKLYGYRQNVGKKEYTARGLVNESGGKKLEKSTILVPSENSRKLRDFCLKNRVSFQVNEIWSDSF